MDEARWAEVTRERMSLSDLLEGLTPAQWQAPSLCSGWRVKDVAAHVAMTPIPAPSLWGLGVAVARARGRLWEASAAIAIDHARRPNEAIIAELRRYAAARTLPSFANPKNQLLDVLVHGQDIAVPFGIERPMPTDAAVAAFDRVWSMGWPFLARRRLRGVRLRATDGPVDAGAGPKVEGRLADLLLLAADRATAALPRLQGEGVAVLADRIGPQLE